MINIFKTLLILAHNSNIITVTNSIIKKLIFLFSFLSPNIIYNFFDFTFLQLNIIVITFNLLIVPHCARLDCYEWFNVDASIIYIAILFTQVNNHHIINIKESKRLLGVFVWINSQISFDTSNFWLNKKFLRLWYFININCLCWRWNNVS